MKYAITNEDQTLFLALVGNIYGWSDNFCRALLFDTEADAEWYEDHDAHDFLYIDSPVYNYVNLVEPYKVGQRLLTIGSDEHCFDIVTSCVVKSIENGGEIWFDKKIGMYGSMDEFNDGWYKNTKANRKMLQDQCDAKYKAWRKAVDKQMAEINQNIADGKADKVASIA